MKSITLPVAAFALLAFASTGLAFQGQGNSRPQAQSAGDKVRAALPESQPVFTTREIEIISGWFRTRRGNLPPGLAKRESLPPGLQKQLVRNGKLPPGLEKKLHPLPLELDRQLVLLPTGYRRVVIGGNVVIMNPVTGVIYDVLRNAIP